MPRPGSTSYWQVLENARAKKIVAWLRRKPVPHQLLCTDQVGEDKTIQVITETGKVKWTDIAEAAYDSVLLVALDAKGSVLRQLKLDPKEDPELANQLTLDAQKKEAREQMIPGREPIISVDVPKLVESIAVNMQKAAATAAEQQSKAFSEGFKAMTSVVTMSLELMHKLERRLDAERETRAELEEERRLELEAHAEEVEEPGGDRTELAVAAAMQALGVGGPRNGPTNGKAEGVDPELALRLGALLKQYVPNPTEG
jgi:hypothetical protein